jgi:hypothetical protein
VLGKTTNTWDKLGGWWYGRNNCIRIGS